MPLSTGVLRLTIVSFTVRPPKLRLTWGVPPAIVDRAVPPMAPPMSNSALANTLGWLPERLMRLSPDW